MSRRFENFVMNVLPWKTITICLMVVAAAQIGFAAVEVVQAIQSFF